MDVQSPHGRVSAWLARLDGALEARDPKAFASLFAPDGHWRDVVAFSWNITTAEGRESVADMAAATLDAARGRAVALDGQASETDGVAEAWFSFETEVVRGRGHVRLKDDGAWTLLTTAQELKGHEEPRGPRRPRGVEHGVHPGRETWAEARAREARELGYARQPYVVIVGGGQGGIALGARLRQLDVPTIVLERNPRAGDSWRNRYKSLCLHDPVWYDHLPYIPFPDHWPVFTPKDKLGDWLESYVKVMELDYWTSSACRRAAYDEAAGEWTVVVDRDGEEVVLKPKHLVLATGMAGVPNIPELPGAKDFEGELHHSSKHPGGEGYEGARCVVIGSNNSAHDICADLWEHGAEVTMVQRSSTHVSRSETLMELGIGPLYSEEALARGITTEKADLIAASMPYALQGPRLKALVAAQKARDRAFYERLEAAGFLHDFGEDGTGLSMKYLRRGAGYYIDVGASELVANGSIRLAHGRIARLTADAVVLEDGTELPADLVVLATGYGSMNGWAAELIGQEVADRVGKCWGLGSGTTNDPGPWEGELRNMWKPTQQEALWFHGGNLAQSRHYSRFLALQLKARQVGLSTPVYGLPKVHHKS